MISLLSLLNEIEIINPNIKFVRDLKYESPYSEISRLPIDFGSAFRMQDGGRIGRALGFELWQASILAKYGDDIKVKISKNRGKNKWFHDEFVLTLVK